MIGQPHKQSQQLRLINLSTGEQADERQQGDMEEMGKSFKFERESDNGQRDKEKERNTKWKVGNARGRLSLRRD